MLSPWGPCIPTLAYIVYVLSYRARVRKYVRRRHVDASTCLDGNFPMVYLDAKTTRFWWGTVGLTPFTAAETCQEMVFDSLTDANFPIMCLD